MVAFTSGPYNESPVKKLKVLLILFVLYIVFTSILNNTGTTWQRLVCLLSYLARFFRAVFSLCRISWSFGEGGDPGLGEEDGLKGGCRGRYAGDSHGGLSSLKDKVEQSRMVSKSSLSGEDKTKLFV